MCGGDLDNETDGLACRPRRGDRGGRGGRVRVGAARAAGEMAADENVAR